MQTVFSYRRFSHEKQSKGSSLERQLSDARDYCRNKGLTLNEDFSFEDTGVSAFHGRNSDTGRLGDFKRAIEDGIVPNDCILCVESLDRISRQSARKALRVLEDICELGVTVITLSDGKSYTKENLDDDPTSLLIALLIFIRANEESKIKSIRVKDAWKRRKKRAVDDGYRLREVYPKWLDRDGNIIEERATVVQRIVREYLAGKTMKQIALDLNATGIPCFKSGKAWWDNEVRRILTRPAIIGQYKGREGYFPACITTEQWQDVTALRKSKARPKQKTGQAFVNPLSAIARCCECGSLMTRVSKGTGNSHGRPKLVCLDWKRGRVVHSYHAIDLDNAVEKVLSLLPVIMDEQPSGDDSIDEEVFRVNQELVNSQQQIERLIQFVAEGTDSEAVGSRITALEGHQKKLAAELADLESLASATAPASQLRRRDDLLRNLSTNDPALLNVKLRAVLKGVVFTVEGGIKEWQFLGSPAASATEGQELIEGLVSAKRNEGRRRAGV
jgi:DNA invertase Pin-like site-specific DNA recombinase